MSEMLTDEELYDAMNEVQSRITVELESAGFDPCPALHISQEATKMAWDLWGKFQERIAELEKERNDAFRHRESFHNKLSDVEDLLAGFPWTAAELADQDTVVDGVRALIQQNQQLREALEAFKVLLDNETLVRNVENDDAPDWASRQLPLIAALKKMERALSTPAPSLADHDREVAERCATIADRIAAEYNGSGYMDWVERKCEECMESTANDIADAIRAEFRKGDK